VPTKHWCLLPKRLTLIKRWRKSQTSRLGKELPHIRLLSYTTSSPSGDSLWLGGSDRKLMWGGALPVQTTLWFHLISLTGGGPPWKRVVRQVLYDSPDPSRTRGRESSRRGESLVFPCDRKHASSPRKGNLRVVHRFIQRRQMNPVATLVTFDVVGTVMNSPFRLTTQNHTPEY
jgi:hypothetical protein